MLLSLTYHWLVFLLIIGVRDQGKLHVCLPSISSFAASALAHICLSEGNKSEVLKEISEITTGIVSIGWTEITLLIGFYLMLNLNAHTPSIRGQVCYLDCQQDRYLPVRFWIYTRSQLVLGIIKARLYIGTEKADYFWHLLDTKPMSIAKAVIVWVPIVQLWVISSCLLCRM